MKLSENINFKDMSNLQLQEFICKLSNDFKRAEPVVSFWGTRKVRIFQEPAIQIDKIARLATELYRQCNDRKLQTGIYNYAQVVVNQVNDFYFQTDQQIANSSICKKVIVWFREFLDRHHPYSSRSNIEMDAV